MQNGRKLVVMLSTLLIAPVVMADEAESADYSYLSAGVALDNSGWADPLAKKFSVATQGVLTEEALMLKKGAVGGYLSGSYAIDDNWFSELRLRGFNNRSVGYFAGVGYHAPICENASFYVLAGISQPSLPKKVYINSMGGRVLRESLHTMKAEGMSDWTVGDIRRCIKEQTLDNSVLTAGKSIVSDSKVTDDQKFSDACKKMNVEPNAEVQILKLAMDVGGTTRDTILRDDKDAQALAKSAVVVESQLAPTIEVGSQVSITEQFKMRLAYQLRYDSFKYEGAMIDPMTFGVKSVSEKSQSLSHEGSVEGRYVLSDNWQAEVGCTVSKMSKVADISPNTSYRVNLGLRYTF